KTTLGTLPEVGVESSNANGLSSLIGKWSCILNFKILHCDTENCSSNRRLHVCNLPLHPSTKFWDTIHIVISDDFDLMIDQDSTSGQDINVAPTYTDVELLNISY